MADIIQQLMVKAPVSRVFQAMSTPAGLDRWWTKTSSGTPEEGGEYSLFFGPDYDWRARVTKYRVNSAFELEITKAHPDWLGTRVGCELQEEASDRTSLRFYHLGWPDENEHWRVSCHCWALYLRIMRRNLEHGENVPYEQRLDV
ncbi:MAG: SRPBCC domain-containing protein [Acidobacteria bacterium]|nr:SRPBCC domain-containing protein [Acidobacteriota bacterium]